MQFLKKFRPDVTRQDLLELIQVTPDANPKTHLFVVPGELEYGMRWAIGKPFCFCLWHENFEGYSIQPNGHSQELDLISYAQHIELYGYSHTICR